MQQLLGLHKGAAGNMKAAALSLYCCSNTGMA
jgi:hypothetical protein